MREPMRDPGRLEDILDASMLIVDSTSNITYEQFLRERLKYFGIIKNVEIIGEAAKDASCSCSWLCLNFA